MFKKTKNAQKFLVETEVGKEFAVNYSSQLFKTPNTSKGKVYKFSDLITYTIYASGSKTNLLEIEKRLKAREDYLAYESFTSLWIEVLVRSEDKTEENVQKIIFYTSPIYAGEPQRRKYVKEACRISEILEKILSEQKNSSQ
ncbi:hypothetical protein OfM1_05130 [Lactovum odontotermitis]